VLVQHVGQDQGVGVRAVRGQEGQGLLPVALAQPVQSRLVHLDLPRTGVQRPHRGRPHIDGQPALHRDQLVQRGHGPLAHLALGQVELVGELAQLGSKRRAAGDLLHHLARHLVAVSGQVSLGPLQGKHRAPEDEPGEVLVVVRTVRGSEIGAQLAEHRRRSDHHPRPIRFPLGHPLLETQDRAAQSGQREHLRPARGRVASALPGQPRHPHRHHQGVIVLVQSRGQRRLVGVDHLGGCGTVTGLA